MISEKMKGYVQNSSVIRAMFEEGKKMAAIYGADHVYDFSLGNPNVPAPNAVKEAIIDIVTNEDPVLVHGYMSNSGFEDVRTKIAELLNGQYGTSYTFNNLVMIVGAAGGMNVFFKTLLNAGDEVVTFSPYFGEYRAYVSNFDGVLVEVQTDPVTFEPDPKALAAAVTPKTKAVILNSPNNPTGVVYSEECIREIARLLEEKQKEYGTTIFIFSDEPYREIVYGEYKVPWIPNYYRNTVVGYSYSKSLSLPGERIGYLVLPSEIDDADDMISAAYAENRQMLMDGLREAGYTFVEPQGAFYLWLKSPEEDERAFVAKCKEKQILIVPGSSFGCAGWTRVAYCVSHETVKNSLPGFREVAASYGLC